MKCPECDSIQPDNAALCSKCGLSFAAWNAINPEPSPKKQAAEEEMTFPVPEEEEPEPEEKPEAQPAENSNEKKTTSGASKEKKIAGKNQKTILFAGAGGLVLVILVFLVMGRKHNQTLPPVVETTPSTPVVTPQINAVSSPLLPSVTNTPTAMAPTMTPTHIKPTKTPTTVPPAAAVEAPSATPTAVPPASSPSGEKASSDNPTPPSETKDEAVTLEVAGEDESPTPSSGSAAAPTAVPTKAASPEAPQK